MVVHRYAHLRFHTYAPNRNGTQYREALNVVLTYTCLRRSSSILRRNRLELLLWPSEIHVTPGCTGSYI